MKSVDKEKKEIEIIKKLVRSESAIEYCKTEDDNYIIKILPTNKIEIIIVDDSVIEELAHSIIIFENDDDVIDELSIIIESGKYHNTNDDYLIGSELYPDDACYDNNTFTLFCNNQINKLSISQILCTEHIYSYYGNQDGFNPTDIFITYNTNKYRNIEFSGKLNIIGNDHVDLTQYNLTISTNK